MGYIGNWIETRNAKVVILVNENEIGFGQKDKDQVKILYQNTKEKLVAFSCDFHQNISDIFNQLTSHLDERIINEKNLIIDFCNAFNVKNLRTLNIFFQLTQRVISHLNTNYNFQIRSILAFMLSVTNEAYKGNISSKNIKEASELKDIDHIKILDTVHARMINGEHFSNKSYGMRFYDKYLKNCPCSFDFYSSLLTYILTGSFDKEAFKTEVSKCREKEMRPEYKILNAFRLKHFSEFDETIFKYNIKALFEFSRKGLYDLNEYYSIADIFFRLKDLKLINYSIQRIFSMCKMGISISKQRYIHSEDNNDDHFVRLYYEIPQLKEVYIMIEKAKRDIKIQSLNLLN